MQTHDFEKHVQKELAEFSLEPTDGVWQNVELRINKERKKRRIVFFWLFAGIVLLGGGAGLFYIDSNGEERIIAHVEKSSSNYTTEKNKTNSAIESAKANEADGKKGSLVDIEQVRNENANKSAEEDKLSQQKRTLNQTKRATSGRSSKDQSNPDQRTAGSTKFTKPHLTIHKVEEQPGSFASSDDEMKANKKNMENSVALSHELSSNPVIEKSTFGSSSITKANRSPADSAALTGAAATPKNVTADSNIATTERKKASRKNWSYGFSGMGGISDNLNGLYVGPSAATVRSASLSSTTVSNTVPPLSLNFKSSLAFGVGFFAQRNLTKKLAIDLGVSYQYQSTRSKVGSLSSVGGSFYDSALSKQATVAAYYSAGDNINYTNHYHFIQLPINLLWQLNKSVKRPVTVFTGITPAYLMGSNALYANYKQGIYYQDKEQFNRVQINGQLGMLFTIASIGKYHVQIGPVAQYEFTNLTKSIISPKQHLLFFGLKSKFTIK